MTLSFRCGCGQPLEVDAEYAGQQVECPTCQKVVTAPAAAAVAAPAIAKRVVRNPAPAADAAYEVVDAPTKPGSRSRRDADDDDDPPPVGRPRRTKRSEVELDEMRYLDPPKRSPWFETEKRVLRNGVGGGAVAMAIAVVWFFAGLAAGRIFFYPPILFLVGLAAVVMAMRSRGEDD